MQKESTESDRDRKVLIVDDEEFILNSLKRSFWKEPYTVYYANGGDEALSIIEREEVQVIVTDQRMPNMTGVELLEKVRQINPDSIRIILSGYSDFATIQDAINRGRIFRFLSKPCDNMELKSVIRQALEQFRVFEDNKRVMDRLVQENIRLKNDLSARERSLIITKEILDIIETPLLVLDKECRIVLKNNAAIDFLHSKCGGEESIQTDGDTLCLKYSEVIEDYIQRGFSQWYFYDFDNIPIRLQVRALRSHDKFGYVLLLKEKK